jgi:hypothetical protein
MKQTLWSDAFIKTTQNLDYRLTPHFNLWKNFPLMYLTGDFFLPIGRLDDVG